MLGQLDTFIAFVVVILGISLLITVLNHIATALLGLRGSNLRWGIETLLHHTDERLKEDARRISDEVLQHQLISDSTISKSREWPVVGPLLGRWRTASAIKVGELVQILQKLAKPVPPGGPTHWQHRLTEMLEQHHAQTKARRKAATKALHALTPQAIEKIDQLAPQIAIQVRQSVGDVELWFDSIMDRVSQRYAARVRVLTVIFSIIVAFTLHLDASVLLDQIRSDPDVRARLLASAEAMTKQADLVLGTSVASVYRVAAERLQSEMPELKEAGIPPSFVSEADGTAWVMRAVDAQNQGRRVELRQRYEQFVQEELKNLIGRLGDEATNISTRLQATGLQLIPDYRRHTRKIDNWPDWWLFTEPDASGGVTSWNLHFFGILASAALLSLGAPFWFNTLKTAANLRPVVATKEEEQRAQRG
jgi:hypothetical protein